MGTSLKGSIVVVNFPFSDLTDIKRRPALVIADWQANDVLLCQITSVAHKDDFAVELSENDFVSGFLAKKSYIRSNKLFTADKRTFLSYAGFISDKKVNEVITTINKLLDINF